MSENYYEIISVQTSANVQEIEAAIDAKYNFWRRLVTHHDQATVQRANQNLMLLEEIRGTLTDPQRRSAYDQSLQRLGGLADPNAVAPQSSGIPSGSLPFTPPPPAPAGFPAAQPVAPLQRVDAWVCPKCNKANPIQVMFCQHCGHTIGRQCSNCRSMYEASASFCPSCGLTPEQVQQKLKLEADIQQKSTELQRLQSTTSIVNVSKVGNYAASFAIGWAALMIGGAILFLFSSGISQAYGSLIRLPEQVRPFITSLLGLSGFLRIILLLMTWGSSLATLLLAGMAAGRKPDWLAVLTLVGIVLLGSSFGYPPTFTTFIAMIVVGAIAATHARRERLAVPATILSGVLWITTSFLSMTGPIFRIFAFFPLAASAWLTSMAGLRGWSLADLTEKEAEMKTIERAEQVKRINNEIQLLRFDLEQLSARNER